MIILPRLSLAALVAITLAACSSGVDIAANPATRRAVSQASMATVDPPAALRAVNSYRAARGLPALTLDPTLMEAARSHSRAMRAAGVMSHDAGASFSSRMAALGMRGAAENIAAGQRNLDEVMRGWSNSSGHAANMAAAGMTRMGIAVVGGYWTLILSA